MRRRTKRRIETSKKLLIFCDALLTAVTIATFVAVFCGFEVSSLVTLDMGVVGLVTAAHGFYYNKAKRENILRLGKAYDLKMEQMRSLSEMQDHEGALDIMDIYSQEG